MPTSDSARHGQVNTSAAEIYHRDFVPALFGQFGPILAEAAAIGAGETVLDLACGTGVAALAAEARGARVTGADVNPGMLAVARRNAPAIDWVEAAAEALPFADGAFDAVLCQFALMFFADRARALAEMARVTRPGGRIVLATWESVPRSPGYDRLVPLLGEVVGPHAAEALSAPFCLGAPAAIAAEFTAAGLAATEVTAVAGTARHPSLDGWIETEIGGWTLAGQVDAAQMARLKARAREDLRQWIAADGSVAMPAPALVARLQR
jgi:SAM-dependent methyltransferase